MTQQADHMRRMQDDDAVCYAQMLVKLKHVGEEISEVLKLFPEDAPTDAIAEVIEEQKQTLVEQVQNISSKMVKYIRSSIHASVLQTVATIKSWYPQQDLQCLLEGANPNATDEQIAEYQASAEPIAAQICEDLGWKKE